MDEGMDLDKVSKEWLYDMLQATRGEAKKHRLAKRSWKEYAAELEREITRLESENAQLRSVVESKTAH